MLRMISGLLAAAVRPLKAVADAAEKTSPSPSRPWNPVVTEADTGPTDTEMVEWLEARHAAGDHSDRVVLRMSASSRGWRLHNDSNRSWGTDAMGGEPSGTVRGAIDRGMKAAAWCALDPDRVPTDTERLDWLDLLTGSYTGLVIWRRATQRPGWRLHETSRKGAKPTVREAVADAMGRSGC